MELPPSTDLLMNIEQRQDEVLRGLEELDSRLERTLRECQCPLRLVRPTGEAVA